MKKHAPLLLIDIGSTFLKGGIYLPGRGLCHLTARPFPALKQKGLRVEADAEALLQSTKVLLRRLSQITPGACQVAMATQRSSLVLWHAHDGRPVTPLISWQDRRPQKLCRELQNDYAGLAPTTGLPLSPHYLGPKLAWLLRKRRYLRTALQSGQIRWGTVDSFLLDHLARKAPWIMEKTMNCRSLLADGKSGTWHQPLFELFGIPQDFLPRIYNSRHRPIPLKCGHQLTVHMADQSAAAACIFKQFPRHCLLNLGTGGFFMEPARSRFPCRPGWLSSPVWFMSQSRLFTLEATINGLAGNPWLEMRHLRLQRWQATALEAFCLPDTQGVGAPFWRSRLLRQGNPAFMKLPHPLQCQVWAEGLAFRVRHLWDSAGKTIKPHGLLVTGGLSRHPVLVQLLASTLPCPVQVLDIPEITLAGCATLAVPDYHPRFQVRTIQPESVLAYLPEKYPKWLQWIQRKMRYTVDKASQ